VKVHLQSLIILFVLVAPAFAQQPALSSSQGSAGNVVSNVQSSTGQSQSVSDVPGIGADFQFPLLRTLGGMGLVLFLMIGAYCAFKKFSPQYFNKQRAEKNLRVIETLAMGDRRSISLIEVADSRFLIGNTPHQINLLAALPDDISLVSESAAMPAGFSKPTRRDGGTHFRNLFEVEKKERPRNGGNQLPDEIRAKMRQLREALERP
jgi:flagellar biosynthetic protein FliO